MRRELNAPSLVRLAGALLLCSILAVGTDRAGASPGAGQGPVKVACAGDASACKWPVKSLGEKDGCACFACEYGRKTQRVICVGKEKDKSLLRNLELYKRSPRAAD
jgi:hypothetical protein